MKTVCLHKHVNFYTKTYVLAILVIVYYVEFMHQCNGHIAQIQFLLVNVSSEESLLHVLYLCFLKSNQVLQGRAFSTAEATLPFASVFLSNTLAVAFHYSSSAHGRSEADAVALLPEAVS